VPTALAHALYVANELVRIDAPSYQKAKNLSQTPHSAREITSKSKDGLHLAQIKGD